MFIKQTDGKFEKWVESGLSTFEIRCMVAKIYFSYIKILQEVLLWKRYPWSQKSLKRKYLSIQRVSGKRSKRYHEEKQNKSKLSNKTIPNIFFNFVITVWWRTLRHASAEERGVSVPNDPRLLDTDERKRLLCQKSSSRFGSYNTRAY